MGSCCDLCTKTEIALHKHSLVLGIVVFSWCNSESTILIYSQVKLARNGNNDVCKSYCSPSQCCVPCQIWLWMSAFVNWKVSQYCHIIDLMLMQLHSNSIQICIGTTTRIALCKTFKVWSWQGRRSTRLDYPWFMVSQNIERPKKVVI